MAGDAAAGDAAGARGRRRGRLLAAAGVGALVLLAVVLVLGRGDGGAACGGGDPTSRPVCVAEYYVTRNDAMKCRLLTRELLLSLTQAPTPEAAQATCEENVRGIEPAREVRVLESEVEGSTAQVELLADGREGAMTLVRQDDRWLISSFAG